FEDLGETVRKVGACGGEVGDAQADPCQGPLLPRALGREQRQLATACIGAHEREPVGPLDDVHAEVRNGELGDRVAIFDPQRDVVEAGRLHGTSLPTRPGSTPRLERKPCRVSAWWASPTRSTVQG